MNMRKLSYEEILADRATEEEALRMERHPVIGLLENIRSLYNVGSCFRTADAMLLERLILTGYTPEPPRKEISKTALGAERSVPWESYKHAAEILPRLKEEGYEVWGLELADRSISLDELSVEKMSERVVLIAGNEISGIEDETLALCDRSVAIPMYGVKHSLNVAVAFGVATWELVRQMRTKQGMSSSG